MDDAFDEFGDFANGEIDFGFDDLEGDHGDAAFRSHQASGSGGGGGGVSGSGRAGGVDFVGGIDDFSMGDEPHAGDGVGQSSARFGADVRVKDLFPNADENLSPVVVGVISMIDLGVGIDLRVLACGCRSVEYTPSRSASATLRLREPACVALIRSSGSVSLVGAPTISAAKRAAVMTARVVRKVIQAPIRKIHFRISSLMVRFDLRHPVRLDELQRENPGIASYEPESFCGCILTLRSKDDLWKCKVTVFVSGKCTMTGVKTEKEAEEAFHEVLPIIARHAKRNVALPSQ